MIPNEKYFVTYQDIDDYRVDTVKILKEIVDSSQKMIDYILTTNIALSKENEIILYNNTHKIYMLADNLNLFEFNLTINAALSQIISSIVVVIYKDQNELLPSTREVYYSFLNCMNALYVGLIDQANIFSNEIFVTNKSSLEVSLIIIFMFLAIAILNSYILSYLFVKVSEKKADYLSIFYSIGPNYVCNALERCENFNQKMIIVVDTQLDKKLSIQQQSASKTTKYLDDDQSSQLSFQDTANPISSNQNKNNSEKSIHKTVINSSFAKLRIFICCSMLISTIFGTIIFAILKINFIVIEGEIQIYLATSEYHNNLIMIFNLFREFMFDKTLYVKYIDLEKYLNKEIQNFYVDTIKTTELVNNNRHYLSNELNKWYDEIQYHDICSYSQEFFDTTITEEWRTCSNITQNSSNFVSL